MVRQVIPGINPLHSEPNYTIHGNGAGLCNLVNIETREAVHPHEPIFLLRAADLESQAAMAAYIQVLPPGPDRDTAVETFQKMQLHYKELLPSKRLTHKRR